MNFDIVIRDGYVLDGLGREARKADIGLIGRKIVAIEPEGINPDTSCEIYDASGMVVCPGFIDTHTHDDLQLLFSPAGDDKIRQGVTTVIGGNCGISPAPSCNKHRQALEELLKLEGADSLPPENRTFKNFGSFLSALDQVNLGINYAGLVGHAAIRYAVMGPKSYAPTIQEMDRMKYLFEDSLSSGAIGLSLGLIYAPGVYTTTSELVDIVRTMKSRNGIVAAHIRNEGAAVIEAVNELITIGKEAQVPVHISHHKTADPENKGKSSQTLGILDRARMKGVSVTADVYPYRAASTYLAAILPSWILDTDPEGLRRRMSDQNVINKLKLEIEKDPLDRWRSILKGEKDYRITISHSKLKPEYVGQAVASIARRESRSVYDVVFDLIQMEGFEVTMIIHCMAEEDVQRIIGHSHVMIGSDGIPKMTNGRPHPRLTGTFPRFLGRYVRQKGLLKLEEAIRKITSLAAATFNLTGKGTLAPDWDADIVVFDPERIIDRSTYKNPELPPEGIKYVFVGGKPALIEGQVTGRGNGHVIRGAV